MVAVDVIGVGVVTVDVIAVDVIAVDVVSCDGGVYPRGVAELENPFTPGFGDTPSTLAGRDDVLGRIKAAMTRQRHPDRTLVLTGGRGIGKTAVLNAAEDAAHIRGWAVLNATARRGGHLTDTLMQMALTPANRPEAWQAAPPSRVGYTARSTEQPTASARGLRYSELGATLRSALTDIAAAAADRDSGVLITVDELQAVNDDDAEEFATAIQHLIRRERRPMMFVGAGLPAVERTLFANKDLTFFQRCRRMSLIPLDDTEAEYAAIATVEAAGATIDSEAVDIIVRESSGYPFMVQLVGFHAWEAASVHTGNTSEAAASSDAASSAAALTGTDSSQSPNAPDVFPIRITGPDAEAGAAAARDEMGRLFIQPAWNGLSQQAQRYLHAMSIDDGDSSTTTITSRIASTPAHADRYKQQLIDEGLAVSEGYGRVRFAHRSLRQWLRTNPDLPPPPT